MKTHLVSAAQACQASHPMTVTELLTLFMCLAFVSFVLWGFYKLLMEC